MRLEDFMMMVDGTGNGGHVQACVYEDQFSHRNRNRNVSATEVEELLMSCIASVNLLAGGTAYHINGAYRHWAGQQGILLVKTSYDYEVDDTHYVYRCKLETRASNNVPNQNHTMTTPQEAVTRLLEITATQYPAGVANCGSDAIGYEVTLRGCLDEQECVSSVTPDANHRLQYTIYASSLVRGNHIPNPWTAVKRGELHSLFSRTHGIVGDMSLRKLTDRNQLDSVTPITPADMEWAKQFSYNESEYTGWLPSLGEAIIVHDAVTKFRVYRLGDSNRPLRGSDLSSKTLDRRTYFNGNVSFLVDDNRYSLETGEYFFAPPTEVVSQFNVFQYDAWLADLSEVITMTRVQSRVTFMSNFSTDTELVKSTHTTTKEIRPSKTAGDDPQFTSRANSKRLR